jgi:hypothetical protein
MDSLDTLLAVWINLGTNDYSKLPITMNRLLGQEKKPNIGLEQLYWVALVTLCFGDSKENAGFLNLIVFYETNYVA